MTFYIRNANLWSPTRQIRPHSVNNNGEHNVDQWHRHSTPGTRFVFYICIGNSMASSAIWEKHARVSF